MARERPSVKSTADCVQRSIDALDEIENMDPRNRKRAKKALEKLQKSLLATEEQRRQLRRKALDTGASVAELDRRDAIDFQHIMREAENIKRRAFKTMVATMAHNKKMTSLRGVMAEFLDDPVRAMQMLFDSLERPVLFLKSAREVGVIPGVRRAMEEANAEIAAIYRKVEVSLKTADQATWKAFRRGTDPEFEENVFLAMATGQVREGYARKAAALRLAKIMQDVAEEQIAELRKMGVLTGKIKKWAPQTHNIAKIRMAGRKAWVDFVTDRLDPEMHPNPRESAELIYDRMGESLIPDSLDEASNNMMLNGERVLNFKDGASALDYFKQYGDGTIFDALRSNMDGMVKKKHLVTHWGPRPFEAINQMKLWIREEGLKTLKAQGVELDDATIGAMNTEMKRIDIVTNQWRGENSQTVLHRETRAALGQTIRNLYVAALLGKTALYSIFSDLTLGAWNVAGIRTGRTGGTAGAMLDMIGRAKDVLTDEQKRQFVSEMGLMRSTVHGTMADRWLSTIGGRFGEGTNQGANFLVKASGRLASDLMNWNGVEMLSRGMQASHGLIQVRQMTEFAGRSWDDFLNGNPVLANRMREYGFDESVWKKLSNPAHVAGEMFDLARLDKNTLDALRGFLHTEGRFVVAEPDTVLRARLQGAGLGDGAKGFKRGTVAGEAIRFAAQFQMFPSSVIRHTVARASREGTGRMGTLVSSMSAMAALKIQAEAVLIDNKEPWEWDDPLFMMKVIDQTGLTWFVGSTIFQGAQSKRATGQLDVKSLITAPFGPAVGNLADLVVDESRALSDLIGEDGSAAQFLKDNAEIMLDQGLSLMPFQNHIGVQMGLQQMFQQSFRNMVTDKLIEDKSVDRLLYDQELKSGF